MSQLPASFQDLRVDREGGQRIFAVESPRRTDRPKHSENPGPLHPGQLAESVCFTVHLLDRELRRDWFNRGGRQAKKNLTGSKLARGQAVERELHGRAVENFFVELRP